MQSPGGTRRLTGSKAVVQASGTYEGELVGGRKHGKGVLRYDDGDVFEGMFENDDKKHGVFRWRNGDVYDGDFKNSLMDGYGVFEYRDGRRYEGTWVGGFKHGRGTLRYPNGDVYEGEFFKDMCQGRGVFRDCTDGRVHSGEFHHDKKHGYGVMTFYAGEKLEGNWDNNLLHGTCIFTDANGRRFKERWVQGSREGERVPTGHTDVEMRELLRAQGPPAWKPDASFKTCFHCGAEFTFTTRRHHCRHCGYVFCDSCTQNRISIPRLKLADARVCDECFIAINCDK